MGFLNMMRATRQRNERIVRNQRRLAKLTSPEEKREVANAILINKKKELEEQQAKEQLQGEIKALQRSVGVRGRLRRGGRTTKEKIRSGLAKLKAQRKEMQRSSPFSPQNAPKTAYGGGGSNVFTSGPTGQSVFTSGGGASPFSKQPAKKPEGKTITIKVR